MADAIRLFQTEIGVVALTLGCLGLDIFLPVDERRGKRLASVAMIGTALVALQLAFLWGDFGTALGGSFTQDGLAFYFKVLFVLAALFTLFMVREYQHELKRGHGEFVLLVLFGLVGMTFLASATDFLLFFVALETLTVSLYVMTAYLRDNEASIEAGVKYLVLGALSTAMFLYGLSYVYGATGSTSYAAVAAAFSGGAPSGSFVFGAVLVVASLGFKVAAAPFHLWAPDVYEGAPTPVTAFLSIGSKAAGMAALLRLLLTAFEPATVALTALLGALAALTILYGNLGAIPQTNLKRLLGYSSIGHSGYMLIGLAAYRHTGGEAVLVYLMSYLFSTAAVFLVLVALTGHTRSDEISELSGLSRRSPLLAAGMLLGLLSLAGVPPLAGFFGKFYVLWASVKGGLFWLTFVGVLNVVTSLYYYLKVVKAMYVDAPPANAAPIRLSADQKVFQYLAIAGILALGVVQGPFVSFAAAALR